MRTIGILLIIMSGFGFIAANFAFGDIGISFAFMAIVSLLAGIGFLIAAKPVNAWKAQAMREARAEFKQQSSSTEQ